MQDKLDQALAGAKIAADAAARAIRVNAATFEREAAGFEFLFADLGQIVHKAADDFLALVQARIAAHKAAEAKREAERQAAEAARIAAAEQRAREQEAARIAAEAAAKAAAAQPYAHQPQQALPPVHNPAQQPAAAPSADEPATLKLGDICGRLGFTVSAAFLADMLHIRPARTDGRAALFTESQFALICRQLQSHVSAMAELYAGEPA
jgi:hypothetical protein